MGKQYIVMIKLHKYHVFAIIIAVFLFVVPFFWLKPGEMNIGGDSGRLFYYDPLSSLRVNSLYSIITSGTGGEANGYFTLPFILILIVLKKIVQSPTILIWFYNGLTLSVAFTSCYLISKEMFNNDNLRFDERIKECAAILVGLFYLFSPLSINNTGWETSIMTHSQIFLNPLMFYLMLRYLKTSNTFFLIGALLTTLIFSFNFSFIASPPFFAFYPLSILFLFLYTRYILNKSIPWKQLCTVLILFLSLHIFHLGPQIKNLLSAGTITRATVFNSTGEFARGGLEYFIAVAGYTKKSYALLGLAQSIPDDIISYFFIVFPIILCIGTLLAKRKTNVLLGLFFLVTLFLTTAHISGLGFEFYKLLFRIPGFSMFRNFNGQWSFVYLFFYSIFLGQSLILILNKLARIYRLIILIAFAAILVISGRGLITGSTAIPRHSDTKVRYAIRMDPVYEEVIDFFRNDPIDGKVMSFPLTGPGYQVLQGKDGDAYQGLSMISYLAGKNDFNGFDSVTPYGEVFLRLLAAKDVQSIQRLFSIMNIKYLFYNSDPYIYSKSFKNFAYNYVSQFTPKDQASYVSFIEQFDYEKKLDFGDKYHIYFLNNENYLPHIYSTKDTIYTNDPTRLIFIPHLYGEHLRSAILNIGESKSSDDQIAAFAVNDHPFLLLYANNHLHQHRPFVSVPLDSIFYPLTLIREQLQLWSRRNLRDLSIDFKLMFAAKRIFELYTWGNILPLKQNKMSGFQIQSFYTFNSFNSWEISFSRYEKYMSDLIDWVEKTKISEQELVKNKVKISEQLEQHRLLLKRYIDGHREKVDEYHYLASLIDDMYMRLLNKLNLPDFDISELPYSISILSHQAGEYEVYMEGIGDMLLQLDNAYIEFDGGRMLKIRKIDKEKKHAQFDSISLEGDKQLTFKLHLQNINLVKDSFWINSGETQTSDSLNLRIRNLSIDKTGGLIKEIPGWKPETQYLITFDYLTDGNDVTFRVFDKQVAQEDNPTMHQSRKLYLEKVLGSSTWKTHQSVLTSMPGSIAGFVQLLREYGKEEDVIQIKNFKIEEVKNPAIIFKKKETKIMDAQVSPSIIFSKINPTKYSIKVTNAYNPYTLVFLDTFNANWQLVNPEKNAQTFLDLIYRILSFGTKKIINIIFKNDVDRFNQISAQYFNGDVKEGVHTNIFLDPYVFLSWGKQAIAQESHFRAFDYANAWNIKPEDMDGKMEYTLVLEMSAQNYFYIFLIISISALFILFAYIAFLFRKR